MAGSYEEGVRHKCWATLRREPHNPHDGNAVAVHIDGKRVGYLAREYAQVFAAWSDPLDLTDASFVCPAYVSGGWRGRRGRGHFGVQLGLRWPPRAEAE